jgi:hypothetical protein
MNRYTLELDAPHNQEEPEPCQYCEGTSVACYACDEQKEKCDCQEYEESYCRKCDGTGIKPEDD